MNTNDIRTAAAEAIRYNLADLNRQLREAIYARSPSGFTRSLSTQIEAAKAAIASV